MTSLQISGVIAIMIMVLFLFSKKTQRDGISVIAVIVASILVLVITFDWPFVSSLLAHLQPGQVHAAPVVSSAHHAAAQTVHKTQQHASAQPKAVVPAASGNSWLAQIEHSFEMVFGFGIVLILLFLISLLHRARSRRPRTSFLVHCAECIATDDGFPLYGYEDGTERRTGRLCEECAIRLNGIVLEQKVGRR